MTARLSRRRDRAGFGTRVLLAAGAAGALLVCGTTMVTLSAVPAPAALTAQAEPRVMAGRDLYLTGCSSCHGPDGRGTERGPTLAGVGAASADFFLTTGRMPLDEPRDQAQRKQPAYSRPEIDQLVAYVASLGPGPEIPHVDPKSGDLPEGFELYANNCASCHSSAGAGGALGHALIAPSLGEATPTQVAEALRIGPGSMPVFGPDVLDEHQVASVVRYVDYLQDPADPGGLSLGRLGPIPEGFVAWVVGLGLMLVFIRWIGTTE